MENLGSEIARDATDTARELAGVVRVSTMEGFGSFYLAARLSRFVGRHPQLKIQLVNARHVLNLSEREAEHYSRSIVTGASPEMPRARAAAGVTSMIRLLTNGPRSLMVTTTERPLL